MPDVSDFFRGYARDVGLAPAAGPYDNVQDAIAAMYAGGGGLLSATVHLDGAALAVLADTPTTVVPAPGAGIVVAFVSGFAEYIRPGAGLSHYDGNLWLAYPGAPANPYNVSENIANATMDQLPEVSSVRSFGVNVSTPAGPLRVHANGAALVATADTNPTPVGPITTATLDAGGTGYADGDTGTIGPNNFTGSSTATYVVDTVDGGGAVLTFTVTDPGDGYTTGDNPETTATAGAQPGVGTGFQVNVTAIPAAGGDMYLTVLYRLLDLH